MPLQAGRSQPLLLDLWNHTDLGSNSSAVVHKCEMLDKWLYSHMTLVPNNAQLAELAKYKN